MPPQPPILGNVPLRVPRVPGARNLTADQLRDDDIITIADVASTFAQTTLGDLIDFFSPDVVVENMAALAALTHTHRGVLVEGFYEPGDGGGGQFVWEEDNDSDPVPGMIVELDSGIDGRYVRIYETFLNVKWFGAKGDGSTNDTAAVQAAVDFPITLGSGDFGAATLYAPSGTYKIGEITTDVQGLTICGDSVFAPRFTAVTAAQAHLFHFTNESAAIELRDIQITGWLETTELASYPTVGLIFEGGTQNIHDCNINRCRGLVWIKRGNRNRIWKTHHGFFDQYAVKLAGIDNGGDASISETRITESTFYSGASSISGGADMYYGTQVQLATDCGATILENCDGGSTVIGIELVDDLNLGNDRGPGFVTLRGYTAGNCEEAGVWIKNNGASFSAENCDFSAAGADSGDGIRVDSPTAAPRVYTSDFHNCQRSGIRVTDAWSVTVLGSTFRDIGIGGGTPAPGIGIHFVEGSAKGYIYNCIFDPDLQVDVPAEMDFAVRLATDFTGVVSVFGCDAINMLVANWSNASDTGTLKTYDNSDFFVVPPTARAEDINAALTEFATLVFPYPVTLSDTVTVAPEKTLVFLTSGEPNVISTADPIFEVGGSGLERTTHGPFFQGELWVDGIDKEDLAWAFHVVPETYKLCFETLFVTNVGTVMTGHRGNIRGIFIDRLFMYDVKDYGIRFYSDTRSLEIDTICIDHVLSNTNESAPECVWLDFGPRVGSGGKNGANVGPGIMYRGKNQVHTWGVLELTAQSWAATDGGQVTFTTEYKHGIRPGDVFFIGGSVPTGYNNLTTGYTALAGTTGKTLIAALTPDPGASTTLGFYTVTADVVPAGNVIFNAPRKMRFTNTSLRGAVDDGMNLQAGADFEFTSVTIDDPGTSNFNIPLTAQTWTSQGDDLTAQSWGANVVSFTTTNAHNLNPGDIFEIIGSTPSGYNGVWTAIAGTAGTTLNATLLVDPGASSVLGISRGRLTFTTATPHGLSASDYFVVDDSSPDGYNGTFQAITVPSTTQVTTFRTFDPGVSVTLGNMDIPLNVNASGYHFGIRFHGSYRIRGGMLHECYGNGIRDEAIYAMPSTIDGLLVWNSSWGSPGLSSGLYFAAGCSNRTLVSITSGTGDHWRHASRDITFAVGNVADGNTLTLNGTTITFRNAPTLPFEVLIGATAALTVANLVAFIETSNSTNMLAVTPTISTSGTSTVMTLTHYPGAIGNFYTLARVGANITVGAPRLGGGTGTAVQKYGIEGLADGYRGNRIINANLWNNLTGQQSVTNLPLPPSQGGTGVANDDSSTVTISGAFPITWTVAASTSLTLPAAGTVATLAGAEAFLNKTGYNKVAITAPATAATLAIADGMTLAFEYGSWTPVATFATPGDLAVVYATQTASYIKIGPWVFWNLNLVFTPTFTTAAGNFQITGLPFTPVNTTVGACIANSNLTWPGATTQIVNTVPASAVISLRGLASASASVFLTVSAMPTTLEQNITLSGAFRVS